MKEIHDLLQRILGLFLTGHIGKGNARLLLDIGLRLRLSHAQSGTAAHRAHHQLYEQEKDHQRKHNRHQNRSDGASDSLILLGIGNAGPLEQIVQAVFITDKQGVIFFS